MGYLERQPNSVIGYEPIAQINQRLAELAIVGQNIGQLQLTTDSKRTEGTSVELDMQLDARDELAENLAYYIEQNGLSSCIPTGVAISPDKIRLHPALAHRTIEDVRSFE